MTIFAKGTETSFSDTKGAIIRIGDRLKSTKDGSFLTIDKFGRAVSQLGFVYDLKNKVTARGMNEDGTYFAKLGDWQITTDEPPKTDPDKTVSAEDVASIAPKGMQDPSLKTVKEMEEEEVKKGVTEKQAKAIIKRQKKTAAKPRKAPKKDKKDDTPKIVWDVVERPKYTPYEMGFCSSPLSDDELIQELRTRGFTGTLRLTKTYEL